MNAYVSMPDLLLTV